MAHVKIRNRKNRGVQFYFPINVASAALKGLADMLRQEAQSYFDCSGCVSTLNILEYWVVYLYSQVILANEEAEIVTMAIAVQTKNLTKQAYIPTATLSTAVCFVFARIFSQNSFWSMRFDIFYGVALLLVLFHLHSSAFLQLFSYSRIGDKLSDMCI